MGKVIFLILLLLNRDIYFRKWMIYNERFLCLNNTFEEPLLMLHSIPPEYLVVPKPIVLDLPLNHMVDLICDLVQGSI